MLENQFFFQLFFLVRHFLLSSNFYLIIYWLFLIGANAFLLIGGFKSATIYVKEKQRKKQNSGWGIAAQILIVLGGIYTVLEVLKVLLS